MRNETPAFRLLMSFVKVGYWGHQDVPMFGWRAVQNRDAQTWETEVLHVSEDSG